MATSSITDNIVIRGEKQLDAFANAVEEAADSPVQYRKTPIRMVTDKEELRQLLEKRRRLHG